MNIKGLKLNKILAKKLSVSFDSISLTNLHGIDTFNSFSWIGFSREEFKNLLLLFSYLLECGAFNYISNFHPFVFNYSTDITEMDIVTVLRKETAPVFLDIESKNGEDFDALAIKINEQINKRVEDYLPQLIKNGSYIVAGFVNNTFIKGYYYDGEVKNTINSLENLVSLISCFSEYEGCEDYLVQSSNLASIVKVCNDIRYGTFKYFEETNKAYKAITSKVESEDVFVVYGNAGTGKSILALRLLFEMPNTKILLINSKLYYSLDMSGLYKSGRATYNTKTFLSSIDEKTISIVDECQRISIEDMVQIISKSKYTFLFGDSKQAFTKKCTLKSPKELVDTLTKDYGLKVSCKVIKKAKRYSDEADKAISMLTSFSDEKKDFKLPGDYQINLFYDEKEFVNAYETTTGIKKLYCPLNESFAYLEVGGRTFEKASYNDDRFSIWTGGEKYYGIVYHALSFDIDHCFVILNKTTMLPYEKKKFLFYSNHFGDISFNDIQTYANELNVLFTRGRKSLNILVSDIEVYLYFNRLINKFK